MLLKRKIKKVIRKHVKEASKETLSKVIHKEVEHTPVEESKGGSKLLRWFLALYLVRRLSSKQVSPLQKIRDLFDAIGSILDTLCLLVLFLHLLEDLKARRR